jgi:hypothetical protein
LLYLDVYSSVVAKLLPARRLVDAIRMRAARMLPGLVLALLLLGGVGCASADTWYSVSDPVNPAYLTGMPYGDQSQWIQQWRAYVTTPPATALRDGMGINFNVPTAQAAVAAQLLAASGIKRARVEISWANVSYSNPAQFSNASYLTTIITALRDNGIRPLILLNANSGGPGPMLTFSATLAASASAGATSVQLDAATAAQVIPGYSGLNNNGDAAGIIFTSVNGNDVATLSRPLPSAFAAGAYPASTLLNQPFAQPLLADGSPNPEFDATLDAWLGYVRMTMNLVASAYGSDNFDVEIWNELATDSDFLNLGNYYNPLPQPTEGNTDNAILDATIDFLRNPANDWPDVQIGNGFTNGTGVDSGTDQPVGLNAIDKHPYTQLIQFPWGEPGGAPLDALGDPDYTTVNNQITPKFVPTYDAFFPEYWLTGLQTATLIRDIAPIATTTNAFFTGGIGGQVAQLGRDTAPPGGTPPATWVTETGMEPTAMNDFPDALTSSDYDHIHAKAALRTYVSFIGKGVQAVDLYAVDGYPAWNNVDPAFFSAAQVGTSNTYAYPGTALGGPVMDATRRLAASLAGAQRITTPRPLSLLGIASDSNAYQFVGDGTAAHPTLYDRDLLVFQPFQITTNSWVAGVYVMTRNIAKVYNESLPDTDPTRTDLPLENFRITIGGVDSDSLTASATDPLSGNSVPVQVIARDGSQATVQMPVTDSPEMLTLSDAPILGPASRSPSTPAATAPGSSPALSPTTHIPTRAHSVPVTGGSAFAATSSVVVAGRAVYLQIKCRVACRTRWSVTLRASGSRAGRRGAHSGLLRAHKATRIRVATLSSTVRRKQPAGTVTLVITDPSGKATIERRLPIKRS